MLYFIDPVITIELCPFIQLKKIKIIIYNNSKFDILLNKKSIIKCYSFEKTHISLIKDKKIINNKDKIDNLDLQNKITEKFNWFFLK